MDNKMTRRGAMKRLGIAVASVVAASSGLFSLASCDEARKKRIVLYFTGTGNCLYVARQLGYTELLSIPQLMKQHRFDIEADEIGIVYPIYGHMPPNMVRRFIQSATLKADYMFAILTYGNRKCNAVEIWDEISRLAGNRFDYINTIIMVDNWLPSFDMNEQILLDKNIPENLQKINADLAVQKRWHEPVTAEEREQHKVFLARTGIDPSTGFALRSETCFTVTDACIGCGVCVSVCPCGNYELTSQGVKMQGDCEYCFACIQNCPQKAIGFIKSEDGSFPSGTEKNPNARYRNEHVSLMDIKRSNSQF